MSLIEFAKIEMNFKEKRDDPPPGKFALYLGSGDGSINGRGITGNIDWNLYEDQSKAICDVHFIGMITTDDSAEIEFEALGFFMREGESSLWSLTSGIKFSTDNENYSYLDNRVGVMEGKFDMDAYVHNHAIYLPG